MALRRIIRAIDLHSRVLVTHYGLTGPQLVILRLLGDRQGVAVSELASEAPLSQATVTGILDRLERRGLVVRRRGEQDKRKVLVRLTDAGRDALAGAPPLLQEHFTARLAELKDWERTQILSSLQRVVAMMEAEDLSATAILATGPADATRERTEQFLSPGNPARPRDGTGPPVGRQDKTEDRDPNGRSE